MSDSEENEDPVHIEKGVGKFAGLKFVSFTKLVAGIGGDNAKFSKSLTLTDTTEGTFFIDSLTKWNDQDHNATFREFTNEIPSADLQTYAQLLHNKDLVVNTLLKHMRIEPKSKSIPAFCELLSSLARDFKNEFDEYIWQSFDVLANILDCGEQEKDSVEAAYYALSILVKVLWKKLAKNIKVSFSHFAPLFGSRRSYVQRFAAESFSFIVRKLNDLKPVVSFIINHSFKVNDNNLKEGCSILLFNVYKGWSGKFHSEAEQLISEIIGSVLSLENNELKQHGFEIISMMIEKTIEYVEKQNATLTCLENVLLKSLENTRSMDNCSLFLSLLTLIFKGADHKAMLIEKKRIKKILISLISSKYFVINNTFVDFTTQYVSHISTDSSAVREIFSELSNIKTEDERHLEQILELFEMVIDVNMFELNIMPYLGGKASDILEKNSTLQSKLMKVYARLCTTKKPLLNSFSHNRSVFFDLSKHSAVKNYINLKLPELHKLDIELVTSIVVVWPWLFSKGEKIDGAEFIQKRLLSLLKSEDIFEELSLHCFVLGSSLFLTKKDMVACIPEELVTNHVRKCNYSQSSLLFLQIYLLSNGEQKDLEVFKRTVSLLSSTFSSPSTSIRKTSLEILTNFTLILEGNTNEENSKLTPVESAFKVLLDAETTNIVDYRERLRHFRKLVYGTHTRYLPEGCNRDFEHVLLRMGLSQFHVQFTVLWPGMHEFLTSYARGMNSDEFWTIITDTLKENSIPVTTTNKISYLSDGIDENDKYDLIASKIQVLKFISTISDIAEQRTKYLSPLLLDFCREYFHRRLQKTASGESLNSRQYNKILYAFLDIYSKFSHAQNVSMGKELKEVYKKLLHYPDMQMMKTALASLFTYRSKALLKYKENLEALVDEKKFKNQLVLFKISNEDGDAVLLGEHRDEVMPILLRILFGVLQSHQNSKNSETYRRSIFRFLNGCAPKELQLFIELILQESLSQFEDASMDFSKMELYCSDKEKLNNIGLFQLKRTVSNILELIKRIPRSFTENQQTQIFKSLLIFGVIIRAQIKNELEEKNLAEAKQLRKVLIECFTEFFKAYTIRKLNNEEVRCFLSVTINCYLTEANENGKIIAVVPLSILRMLSTLCKLPSFWPLLSILINVEFMKTKISLFEIMITHLFWSGVTPEIIEFTRGGLISLLTLRDEPSVLEEEGIEKMHIITKNENFGTVLILQHMQLVISFLSESLEKEVKLKDPNFANLDIINRLCTYVNDDSLGERMAQLLSVHLERKLPNDENLQKLLNTLGKLIIKVKNPVNFLPRITRLFIEINGRLSREALVIVVEGLIENQYMPDAIKKYLPLVADLESWDRRRVDEPDHDRRHSAYNKLFEMWTSRTQFDPDFMSMVIHVNFHTLFSTTDIALRSNSASNIRSLAEHISQTPYNAEVKQKLLDKNLISLMLKGFRHDNNVVREECVRCLAKYVSSFPEHEHLSAFVPLQNKDEDLDFFSNLNHIQLHRRQRGINRLVNSIRDGKIIIPFEVLYRFLIPIIYHYLVLQTSNTSALSDECLRLFSLTFELAPWQSYISTLDHWLARLKKESGNEKPIVRVLVAVIDAFHFEVADAQKNMDESNSTAIIIRDKISKDVLPRLRKCINGKAGSIEVHKKAKTSASSYSADEDDLMRAPVALATIKLLHKLPAYIMNQHLHGVILKLCWLMNSRAYKVRETARKVTLQVCESLGSKYLSPIIKEMTLVMNKGFQVHVLIYTVHTFINSLQSKLSTGDLDPCLDELINLCLKDQFEDTADEKEVGAIKAEVPEAKGNKTPETLAFLGKFVSPQSLGYVLEKFQNLLEKKASSKTVSRVGNLLSKFAIGIKENTGLSPTDQLIFAYQTISNNIERMENTEKKAGLNEGPIQNTSCLIIPEAPKRVGALVKSSVKSRVHVFVEFALQLLSTLIAEKRIDLKEEEEIAKIEPFVPIIIRCLTMKYDKIIAFALRSIYGLLGMNIPSIKDELKPLSQRLFAILADYSMIGNAANKHSVLQLNQTLFKIFTKIISLGDSTLLSKKNIALLLSYIEVDIMDTQKQATAFLLIKAIIRKQIQHERLPEVVKILAELSITSTQAHIRTQCRDVICEYVGNHTQAEEPKKWLEFFLAQLEYEFENGRLSAAETLHKLFSSLLQKVLDETFFFCLLKLASRLVNDELPLCRKYVAMTLRKLLEGVSESSLEDAVAAGCDWLESENEASRVVGIEILIQISFVEGEKFASRLPRIFGNILNQISSTTLFEDNSEQTIVSLIDGAVLIIRNCETVQSQVKIVSILATIIGKCELLAKCLESTKICLATSCFIGQCLSLWKEKSKIPSEFSIETVIHWMCWQLKSPKVNQEIADQSSKNIVCLSQWLDRDQFDNLVKKLATTCKYEIAKLPKEAIRRMTSFKLVAAFAIKDQEGKTFDTVVQEFFPLLVREMNRKSIASTEELCNLANEVGEIIKTRIGEKEYANRLSECQKKVLAKTEERKRKIKELTVTAPEIAAEVKRKKNVKKTQAKKRKIDTFKPYRVAKRQFLEKQRLMHDEE